MGNMKRNLQWMFLHTALLAVGGLAYMKFRFKENEGFFRAPLENRKTTESPASLREKAERDSADVDTAQNTVAYPPLEP